MIQSDNQRCLLAGLRQRHERKLSKKSVSHATADCFAYLLFIGRKMELAEAIRRTQTRTTCTRVRWQQGLASSLRAISAPEGDSKPSRAQHLMPGERSQCGLRPLLLFPAPSLCVAESQCTISFAGRARQLASHLYAMLVTARLLSSWGLPPSSHARLPTFHRRMRILHARPALGEHDAAARRELSPTDYSHIWLYNRTGIS